MSKCTRSLSLILTLILSFSLFSVNAFAVDDTENLVDGNLSNWTDYSEESEYFQSANVSYLDNNVNYIEVSSSSYPVYIFDVTEFLKIGESYNFSFNLPTTGGSNSTSLNSCELHWCLTDGNGDIVPSYGSDVFEIVVNNSNKSNYLGKTTVFEFTYTQGFQNTFLCLSIIPSENLEVYNDLELYISNISLERVTSESEKKLDGILGWLQDIWDKLVSIGDGLTEVWTNITSSVSALGDRISSFFSELGSKISTEFTNLTSDFSGYISSLGDRFSGFITSLGDRISGFFENLSVNINGFFTDLLDGIKEFFKGFGNLILYFNWEGEYTNPFESSNSIIGGGSDGENGEVEEEKPTGLYYEYDFSKLDLTNFTNSDGNYLYAELLNNNTLYVRGNTVSKKYKDLPFSYVIPSSEFETLKTYAFEFTVSNFQTKSTLYSNYNYFYLSLPNGRYPQVAITDNGTYTYNFTLDTRSIDFAINYLRVAKDYSYCISDIKIYEVVEGGSSGDTGSDEEGTTENLSVQGALDNILEYLSTVTTDIENVMDSITGSIKLFSDFCDEFPFIKALCIFVLALIIYSTVIGL